VREPGAPSGRLAFLKERARILTEVRAFFMVREVLEVETPLLGRGGTTDFHLLPFASAYEPPGGAPRPLFLQTSPELFMKRLLAHGSGPIWQLCKAFRNGEHGTRHNPEFTILEWYRPGWGYRDLMDEVGFLMTRVLGTPTPRAVTFQEAFESAVGVDPHRAGAGELAAAAQRAGIQASLPPDDRDAWLDLILAERIEPDLGRGTPTFLIDYPPDRAALARVRPGDPPVAERFELYLDGVELCNGFQELVDAAEQRLRLEAVNARRVAAGLAALPLDEEFLAALPAMPDSAGVAVGFDRMVMLATGARELAEVLAFDLAAL
jgi:lysyl-tRNA synthetase class 2